MSKPRFSLLHISDLHLIEYLQNSKDTFSSKFRAKPHSYRHAQDLCTCVRLLREEGSDIDNVVVTGDLTTTASLAAFEEVNNFLRGTKYVSNKNRIGLDTGPKVLVVPGNHDTWHKRISWRWKNLLSWIVESYRWDFKGDGWKHFFPENYPYIHHYPNNSAPEITFIGIDTNKFDKPAFRKISQGQVGSRQLADIGDIEGQWPKSLKIALMHHHLALPTDLPDSKYTKLIDDVATTEALFKAGVDLVLCGHQHTAFHLELTHDKYRDKKLFLSCAGSATQLGAEENSFKLYQLFDDYIKIRIWSNKGRAFFEEKDAECIDYPNRSPWMPCHH